MGKAEEKGIGRGNSKKSAKNLEKCDRSQGFQTNPQNIKGGVPKTKGIKTFISRFVGRDVKPVEIKTAQAMLLNCTRAELERIVDDGEKGDSDECLLVVGTAKCLLNIYEHNDTDGLLKIVEHVAGKPKQQVEIEQKLDIDNIALDKLTDAQLNDLAVLLSGVMQTNKEKENE